MLCAPQPQISSAVIKNFLVHKSKYKSGKVPLSMIYRRRYPLATREPYFELPLPFCVMFSQDRYFSTYYSPNVYECVMCHSSKYKRGKVPLTMLVSNIEKCEHVSSRAAKMEQGDVKRMLRTARHYAVTS